MWRTLCNSLLTRGGEAGAPADLSVGLSSCPGLPLELVVPVLAAYQNLTRYTHFCLLKIEPDKNNSLFNFCLVSVSLASLPSLELYFDKITDTTPLSALTQLTT